MTKIKLKLISGIDKSYFVEKELKGWIFCIFKRFSETNNKYMNNYDPPKESRYIIDLDANNIYGCAMSQYVPSGEFKWVKIIDNFEVNSISKNRLCGYILEVDLNIQMNYIIYGMIIHLLQKNLKLLMICCQVIAKKLLTNTTWKLVV